MSPPAAIVETSPSAATSNGLSFKKDLAVKAPPKTQSKALAELQDKWESFTFAPIRESQVSRAMSTSHKRALAVPSPPDS